MVVPANLTGVPAKLYPTFVLPDGATMPGAAKLTTTLSTKGQVILPAAVRRRRNWNAGTRLTVEETADGVLLKLAPLFPPTTPEQVFGCLRYQGEPKTLQDMQEGIAAEVRRRHARGRY
jgi:AbrB family looped-hinge helix DNA binding protein